MATDNNACLEEIRRRAKLTWMRPSVGCTSYADDFRLKSQELGKTVPRPTSPTRINKPHPKLVFMATRLHHVPGYHDADANTDKEIYRVDRSVSQSAFAQRRSLRDKYQPMTDPLALRQYTTNKDFEGSQIEKINDIGVDLPVDKIHDFGEIRNNAETEYLAHIEMMPSLHRYQKLAGYDESKQLKEIKKRHSSKFNCILGAGYRTSSATTMHTPHAAKPRLLTTSETDVQRNRFHSAPRYTWKDQCAMTHTKRGDYRIHPEWRRKDHTQVNLQASRQFPRLRIT